jgi:hypothetical protein
MLGTGTSHHNKQMACPKCACPTNSQHCQMCAHFMLLNIRYLSHLQHTQRTARNAQSDASVLPQSCLGKLRPHYNATPFIYQLSAEAHPSGQHATPAGLPPGLGGGQGCVTCGHFAHDTLRAACISPVTQLCTHMPRQNSSSSWGCQVAACLEPSLLKPST